MQLSLFCISCFVILRHVVYAVSPLPTLNGKTVQCCTIQQFPSVFRDDANHIGHGFSGVGIEYLTQLEVLLDFRCHSITDFTGKIGFSAFVKRLHACANGTASSNIDEVCSCELGTGAWLYNNERYGKVDFLPPFLHDALYTVVNTARTFQSSDGAFYLNTFEVSLWVSIFALLLFFTVLKVFDSKFEPLPIPERVHSSQNKSSKAISNCMVSQSRLRRVRKAFQSSAQRMIGQPDNRFTGETKSTRHWILNFVISLCSIFLILTYGAGMTAKLLQTTIRSPFSSIKDFQSCRIPTSDVCVLGGGATQHFWETIVSPGYRSCNKNPGPIMCKTVQECLTNVSSGKCGYLFTDGITASHAVQGRYCGKLVLTGNPALISQQGFIAPLNSTLTRSLTAGTLWLSAMDRIRTLDQFFHERGPCIVPPDSDITIERLRIFFISAYAICFLILFSMLLVPQDSDEHAIF